jgi:hypothetical protein
MRWRLGEGRAVGSLALFLSLVTHASPPDERTLWRWSYPDTAILGVVALIFIVTVLGLLRPATGPIDSGYRPPAARIASHWIDVGWFLWGLGYLIGSAFLPSSRGRLFELDLFGSVIPGASFLEWGGAVAVIVAVGVVIWQRIGRRSRPAAVLLLLPVTALVAGESWARWQAMYRPCVTPIPSTASARWDRVFAPLNAAGFRDADVATAKPEGTSRVVVLGDETAFGVGITDRADRLSELLALRLAAATGRPWESVNLARVDAHTKDELTLVPAALGYSPDAVVLLYSFDDIDYFTPVKRAEPLASVPRNWRERLDPLRIVYLNSVLFQEAYLRARERYPEYLGGGALPVDPYADSSLVAAHLEDVQAVVQGVEESGVAALVVPFDAAANGAGCPERYQRFVTAASTAELPVLPVDCRPADPRANRVMAEQVARRLIAAMGLPPAGPPPTP